MIFRHSSAMILLTGSNLYQTAQSSVLFEKRSGTPNTMYHTVCSCCHPSVCSRAVQDIVAWVESNVEKLQNRTDDIKRIRDNPVLYR